VSFSSFAGRWSSILLCGPTSPIGAKFCGGCGSKQMGANTDDTREQDLAIAVTMVKNFG